MSGGDVAKVAIPMALTVASGGLAAPALAPALTGGLMGLNAAQAAVAAGALTGAAAGGIGSAVTGGDPLTGAALGGIGGGLTGGLSGGADAAASGIGQAGADATAVAATDAAAQTAGEAAASGIGSYTPTSAATLGGQYNPAALANTASTTPALTSDLAAGIGDVPTVMENAPLSATDKMIGFAQDHPMSVLGSGLGGYMMNGSGDTNEQPIAREERKINNVAPLQRQQLSIDPNAFYGVGGARSGYVKANPNTVYLAEGGRPSDMSDEERAMNLRARIESVGLPQAQTHRGMNDSASMVIEKFIDARANGYKGNLNDFAASQYGGDVPVSSAIRQNYAKGGNVAPLGIGNMVKGMGDGQSDTIPAMLSDGEYVVPAPVVSALGRGSNDAGAKKLDKMKKHIMAKTYKGGKAPNQMGLGSMKVA